MKSIELFSGAGGLALGLSNAGVEHEFLIERDLNACRTLRWNQERGLELVREWNLHQGDVRDVDFSTYSGKIDLLGGGPPCQPFSLGGKHRGSLDQRDMFPEAARAVAEVQPKVFVFENVKGLLRQSFSTYFEYILLRLTYPEIRCKKNEDWESHLGRLEQYHTKGKPDGLHYRVLFRLVNAADYGVPQIRHRVFIVGFRCDLNQEWSFPEKTHSLDALLCSKFVSGEYWDKHKVSKRNREPVPRRYAARVEKLRTENMRSQLKAGRWKTVRDALSGLPRPTSRTGKIIPNHEFRGGARSYPGHTGSPLDEPSKALKAGDHGVPGGENMLRYPDGEVRYFSVRESARIQTFPDAYQFTGSWTEAMRQIGNAVPVRLAEVIGESVVQHAIRN